MFEISDGIEPDDPDCQEASAASATAAMRILQTHRRISEIFGRELLAAPAWEILLILQIHAQGREVDDLCAEFEGAGSPSTIRRWLAVLRQRGIVELVRDIDGRSLCRLKPSARALLTAILNGGAQEGHPVEYI